ncbi:MAG TPA: tetratricopeptide repeat protein [Candidatus Binatia bacterium]|nr:tetratricopeptide repeat protein [Candidatus Binatia bacterium]
MTWADVKAAPQSQSASRRRVSPVVRNAVACAVLMLAILAIYYPVHRQPFANYDDADYVTDNFHVRAGLHWSTLRWAFTTHDAANWHPVTWISHALDCRMFGVTPAGPHDVNVLLHMVNTLLLFWVLQSATGFAGRSWMVAALFALHPINVESVAWIAERKNLLSMLFFLLTLAAYRWYVRADQKTRYRRGGRYLLVAVLFALGLMSKPQVITLPCILLLWDYWPLGRLAIRSSPLAFRRKEQRELPGEKRTTNSQVRLLIAEKVPLLALCGISAVQTLRAQASGGATSGYPHAVRLENALVSYARYLGKAFWPSHLALFYPYPLTPYRLWEVFAAALLLLAVTLAVGLAYRRRYLTVGWLWFAGTMVPMIGVVQVGMQAMADRYAYLPFVGLFLMICWLVAEGVEGRRLPAALVQAGAIAVLVALGLLSHRQVEFWNDHITLWTHTLEVTRNNWVAENNLGTALLKQARVEEAIPHFRAAVALYPADPNSNLNIGTYEQMHHNYPAAIERYQAAAKLARNPKVKARAYNNLAYAYKDIGDFVNARESLQEAVTADPQFSGAWISLGLMAQRTGELPRAISAYSRALQIYPSDFGYLLLAGALEQSGDRARAQEAREKAAALSRNFGAAQRYADELLAH